MAQSGILEFVAKIDDQASAAIGTLERTFDSIGGPIDPILAGIEVDEGDALSDLDRADAAVDAVDGKQAEALVDADTGPAEEELDRFPEKAKESGEEGGKGFGAKFSGALSSPAMAAGIAAAGAAAAFAFGSAFANAMDLDSAVGKMTATLGATAEESERYGDVAASLYADAYGESIGDVATSVDAVVSSIQGMNSATAGELEGVTAGVMNIAEAFDVDVTEAASGVGTLLRNGLATDATQAMDLIVGSMQQMPAAVRGEVFPVLEEYAGFFDQLGIDGPTALGMITAASDDGAIGMDKMGDALKEFTIRATDMSTATSDVYESLGLSTEEMTNALLAGGDTAEGAMAQIVHGLQSIEDPGEQAAAALALFGTPLEDLGTDQIPAFLGMVDPMGDAFDDMAGSAEAMGTALNDNVGTQVEAVKRQFSDLAGGLVAEAMPAIQGVLGFLEEHPGVIQQVAVVLGVLAAAFGIAAAAQWAMNSAMLASPVTWIILGIAAVIAAIVLLIMNWESVVAWLQGVWATVSEWFKGTWDSISAKVSEVWAAIVAWVQGAIESVRETITNVLTGIASWWSETWEAIKTTASGVWDAIVTWVTDKINAVRDTITLVLAAISAAWTAAWNGVRDAAQAVWDAIKLATTTAINAVSSVVSSVMGRVLTGWRNIWDSVKAAAAAVWDAIKAVVRGAIDNVKATIDRVRDVIATVRNAFNGAKDAARDKMNALIDLVRDLPNRILRGLGNLGNLLINAGRDVIQGFIDGITGGFRRVRDKLSELTDLLPDWKGPEDTDKTILVDPGRYVIDGFIAGLEDRYGDAEASLRRFTDGLSAEVDLGPDMTAAGLPGGRTTYTVTTRLDEGDRQLMREFLRYAAKVAERPIETTVKMDRRKLATAVTTAQAWEGER